MCRVSSCCFCVDTERGSLIIAIAGIILSAIQLLSNIGGLTIVGLVTGILGIVINVLLLIGVRKKKPVFVLLWLVVTVVFLILMGITLVWNIIDLIGGRNDTKAAGPIAVYALSFALETYFWIVVYSFYRDLKDTGASNMNV